MLMLLRKEIFMDQYWQLSLMIIFVRFIKPYAILLLCCPVSCSLFDENKFFPSDVHTVTVLKLVMKSHPLRPKALMEYSSCSNVHL